MLSKSRHSKGKRFERFVCQEMEAEGLGKSVRTPGSGSGRIKGDIFNNLDFMVECKNQKKLSWWESIDQAKKQAQIGNHWPEKWALVVKDPRTSESSPDVYAVIDFWQFLKLLKTAQEPRIKKPDKELKYKLERLKINCQQVIKEL